MPARRLTLSKGDVNEAKLGADLIIGGRATSTAVHGEGTLSLDAGNTTQCLVERDVVALKGVLDDGEAVGVVASLGAGVGRTGSGILGVDGAEDGVTVI